MLQTKYLTLFGSAVISFVFLSQSFPAWDKLKGVTTKQIAANEMLIEWKAAYQALLPVNDQWKNRFVSASDVKDLLSLFRVVNLDQHGLISDVDTIKQISGEAVLFNGLSVGLQRVCLGNAGGPLDLTATNMTALRVGLQQLAKRNDIELGSVEITYDRESKKPTARVSDFCLRVRLDSDTKKDTI